MVLFNLSTHRKAFVLFHLTFSNYILCLKSSLKQTCSGLVHLQAQSSFTNASLQIVSLTPFTHADMLWKVIFVMGPIAHFVSSFSN